MADWECVEGGSGAFGSGPGMTRTVICDLCQELDPQDWYDVKIPWGPWANLCQSCYEEMGSPPLGIGKGQHFRKSLLTGRRTYRG